MKNVEESPCSHVSVMIVVFALREKITYGRLILTAKKLPKNMVKVFIKCQRDEFFWKRKKWNVVNPASEKPKIW